MRSEMAEALEDRAHDQGERDGSVVENFGESAALLDRNKLAPGDGLGVRATGESTPIHGFRTDAHTVVVPFERKFFVAAARKKLRVDAELLRPISRNAATDGKDTHAFGRKHRSGIVLEV